MVIYIMDFNFWMSGSHEQQAGGRPGGDPVSPPHSVVSTEFGSPLLLREKKKTLKNFQPIKKIQSYTPNSSCRENNFLTFELSDYTTYSSWETSFL